MRRRTGRQKYIVHRIITRLLSVWKMHTNAQHDIRFVGGMGEEALGITRGNILEVFDLVAECCIVSFPGHELVLLVPKIHRSLPLIPKIRIDRLHLVFVFIQPVRILRDCWFPKR